MIVWKLITHHEQKITIIAINVGIHKYHDNGFETYNIIVTFGKYTMLVKWINY